MKRRRDEDQNDRTAEVEIGSVDASYGGEEWVCFGTTSAGGGGGFGEKGERSEC